MASRGYLILALSFFAATPAFAPPVSQRTLSNAFGLYFATTPQDFSDVANALYEYQRTHDTAESPYDLEQLLDFSYRFQSKDIQKRNIPPEINQRVAEILSDMAFDAPMGTGHSFLRPANFRHHLDDTPSDSTIDRFRYSTDTLYGVIARGCKDETSYRRTIASALLRKVYPETVLFDKADFIYQTRFHKIPEELFADTLEDIVRPENRENRQGFYAALEELPTALSSVNDMHPAADYETRRLSVRDRLRKTDAESLLAPLPRSASESDRSRRAQQVRNLQSAISAMKGTLFQTAVDKVRGLCLWATKSAAPFSINVAPEP